MGNIRDRLYVATFCDRYIEAIRDFGVGMEINHTCISENLDEDGDKREKLIRDISSDIEESGAQRIILHGPFTEIIPAAIDPLMRDMGMKRLKQGYDVAKHFGIRKMVVHNGWLPYMYFKSYQAEKGAEFWQKFMENKGREFILAVENFLEDEPLMIRDMMERIEDPRIRLCLDVGHANCMSSPRYGVEDWIRELGPYITHFHLHNNDGRSDTHNGFTDGTLDMEEVIGCAESCCPGDVTYTIEAHPAYECLELLAEKNLI